MSDCAPHGLASTVQQDNKEPMLIALWCLKREADSIIFWIQDAIKSNYVQYVEIETSYRRGPDVSDKGEGPQYKRDNRSDLSPFPIFASVSIRFGANFEPENEKKPNSKQRMAPARVFDPIHGVRF